MKTAINIRRGFIQCLAIVVIAATATPARAATYYVSESSGNDAWSGQTTGSKGKTGPWKTLGRASIEYAPGDRILLKCGDTWNEDLRPKGSGTPDKPIFIGSYGSGAKPVIDRGDYTKDLFGIYLSDQEGFKIVGIEFNHCMTGIFAEYSDDCPTKKFIWVEDCYFHDSLLYQHYADYPQRKIGLGICFFTYERDKRIVLTDVTIKNCVFRRLASGVWTNNPDNFNKNASFVYNFANMTFDGCLFEEGYQWQMGIRGVDGGAVRNCVTHDIGENFRSFNGVAGAMFFRCKDWVFEDSEWGYVSIGLGSGDGEAFDFEGNCDNMTMRNCLFHDTDGPGFLLCCYASDGNPNKGIRMENCVLNGKTKRPIGLPRCEIVNTTDWTESTWNECRFYLSNGEALMRVMDPEKDKKTSFHNCLVKHLSDACSTPNLAAKAKITASTQVTGNEAAKVQDAEPATTWKAQGDTDEWVQIEFPVPTTVNEFKIKEDPSSSIRRYVIECWDDEQGRWVGCFNGMNIGAEFIAPIVSRTMTKARLFVRQTREGSPAIAEFEAYNDTTSKLSHDLLGNVVSGPRVASAPAPTVTPAPAPKVTPAAAPKPVTAPKPAAADNTAKAGFPETVLVGNPGNQADKTGFGSVAYEYRIGKYEVTNEEYCNFLNAVAKKDPHDLYDPRMAHEGEDDNYGGIRRSGGYGNYTYDVRPGMGKKPANYVTFESCVRYANWLTNGQGDGDTETGSYTIKFGRVAVPNHATLAAGKTTSWALPSENEWYKAAYYDAAKQGGAGYWIYASRSDNVPEANLSSNAPCDVDSFSSSPYGTYNQGGNVWEYNDAQNQGKVGLRGGSFFLNDNETYLRSTTRYDVLSAKWPNYGFRVVALGGATSK
jgi:formylglycine-generating enzyme required for sulfatase activity